MLRELRYANFKCFAALTLPLRQLTLLAGVNGAGKSTVLQGMLLLHQAIAEMGGDGARRTRVPLTGSLLALGSVRDVINKTQGGKTFEIGLSLGDVATTWTFGGGETPRDELAAEVQWTDWGRESNGQLQWKRGSKRLFPPGLISTPSGSEMFQLLARTKYVPADRVGPLEAYPLLDIDRHDSLGDRAERAIGALYWHRDDKLPASRLHPDRNYLPTLSRQVEAWLNDMFPGAALDVQRVVNADLVTLGLRSHEASDFHRPQHVGFGMSYVLSIVIALLSAQPGHLVIIENPEAHLHPKAQVAIIALCVRAATCGIQVILETHSDHVLNSLRVAVYRGRLAPEQVGVHFFSGLAADGNAAHQELQLNSRGRLDGRPVGFFDELERQLTALLERRDQD